MRSGRFRGKSTKFRGAAFAISLFAFCMPFSPSPSYESVPTKEMELPFVQISAISVEPKEVDLTVGHGGASAVVTVSIFHLSLASPQTVHFNVGTYSTVPQTGVTAKYDPPSQIVAIPAGPGGAVVAKARVVHIDTGPNSQAKLTIAASLTDPSGGIRIEQPESPESWRATLTVTHGQRRNAASATGHCAIRVPAGGAEGVFVSAFSDTERVAGSAGVERG